MAYRRKTYKKRFTKRKKTFFKKRYVKKYRPNKTNSYNGQINVKCDITKNMTQASSQGGVKMGILWGAPATALTDAPNNWPTTHVFSHIETPEW